MKTSIFNCPINRFSSRLSSHLVLEPQSFASSCSPSPRRMQSRKCHRESRRRCYLLILISASPETSVLNLPCPQTRTPLPTHQPLQRLPSGSATLQFMILAAIRNPSRTAPCQLRSPTASATGSARRRVTGLPLALTLPLSASPAGAGSAG